MIELSKIESDYGAIGGMESLQALPRVMQAMASYQTVALKTVASVYVRIDVVLAAVNSVEDESPLVLINEMDWFNSAAHMTKNWKQVADVPWDGGNAQPTSSNGLQQSTGFKIAKPLSAIIHEQARLLNLEKA